MDDEDKARREVEEAVADGRLVRFLEALGGAATARAVFGEPVERRGVTVIPVARVRYGAGGGGGRGPGRGRPRQHEGETDQVGYGHGGGVQAGPAGYIELRDGRASYTRIADPVRILLVAPLMPLAVALAVRILTAATGRRSAAGR